MAVAQAAECKNFIWIVFETLKLKPCNLIGQEHFSIFPFNSVNQDYSLICGFNRIIKVIMVHDLKQKKSTHQWIIFLFSFFVAKSKKTYFGGVFGHYLQKKFFPQNQALSVFLPLKHLNFKRSFKKILWAVLKACLPTYMLTYWKQWNHRTPFCLKVEVQKQYVEVHAYLQSSWNGL